MTSEEFLISLGSRYRDKKIYFGELSAFESLFTTNPSIIGSPDPNPTVIAQLEKILRMTYSSEAEAETNVCMANAEEVRFEFRSVFTFLDISNYVRGTLDLEEQSFLPSGDIIIPYPQDPSNFERRATYSGRKPGKK